MLVLASCNDFIAADLTDKNITVLAPSDNVSTTSATISFFWQELDGARTYRLQIAKPSFDSMVSLLVDTSTSGTQFTHVFSPGIYQWRIRAENGSTETPWVTRTITIDSTTDLSSQQLILTDPANNDAVNTTSFTATFYGLYNASQYRLAVKSHTSNFTGSLVVPEITSTDTFITVSGLTEGYLDWGVKGESGLSSTSYTTRSIYIDLTDPLAPMLNTPGNAATITGPDFTLTWTNGADSGSPLSDSVFIYEDASFNVLRKSYYTSTTILTDTIADGTYYWRIKAIDKAGNAGPFSSSRSFTVN
ncbi:MAG TPA: hypothetical protein VD905_01195 [Flavobacteriales bacterium]|nr:hypothetical protein [Flavobacteriales bacterium]